MSTLFERMSANARAVAEEKGWRPYRSQFGNMIHQFLQADGRWQICGGVPVCRECVKEDAERRRIRAEKRRAKRADAEKA